jgi:CRISPR-associated endonuclease Csn1
LLYGGKLKIDDEGKLRVQVSPGRATAYLRQRWNLNGIIGHDDEKNRADHRHHAIDAIVIALTDARRATLSPRRRRGGRSRRPETLRRC